MRIHPLFLSLAALAALPACTGGAEVPGGEAYAVQPRQVTPEALRAAVSDERVQGFYEAREWRPVWTREHARELLVALDEAPRHGLDARRFLAAADQAGDPAQREAALTLAALTYGEALARGYADPEELKEVYTLERPGVDVAAGLHQAIEQKQVGVWLAGLAPQDPEYRALSEAYLAYRQSADEAPGEHIREGDAIRPGDEDPRVPQILEALRANGYLPPPPENGGPEQPQTRYTPEMAQAVERLQEDYGIEVDGVVGSATLEALNTGAAERARILALNLERRRWLARDVSDTRIDVNIPGAFLDYWNGGRHAHHARVVVGTAETDTPPLGSPIFRLVANPSWTVPRSIAERDILPRGDDYLRRQRMTMRDGWIVQEPGPHNALGQVKFDMKNDHAIFLHDTNAPNLFQRTQRHLSNGCVRVEDAVGFARMLADHHGDRGAFDRALATRRETFVSLDREIPVRLLYHTAYVDRGGQVVFRTDPYGWDEDLAEALGMEVRGRRQVRSPLGIAIGP